MFFTLLTLDLTTEWYVEHESLGEATRGSSSQWCKLPLLGRHISLCLESPIVITGTRENMMFLFYINSDDITSPPSLLWWDDISNLGSISSRTNWHWFFFFFLFLSSFLEDSANSQSEGSDNSLAKNLLRWFFCPHWENLGQPDHSAPLGRLELVGAGLGSLLCVRCRHA